MPTPMPAIDLLFAALPAFLTEWNWLPLAGIACIGASLLMLQRARGIQAEAGRKLLSAEEAIGANEQRWRLLFEQSPLSIQIFSPNGQTRQFNQAWRDLFRLSDEQGLSFNVLQAPDLAASGATQLIRRAFDGEPVSVPPVLFPVNTDPPQQRWIGGVLYPVKDKAGKVLEVVVIHHDITEMKRAEEAMQALNQTLENRVAKRTTELEAAQVGLARALEAERELGNLKSRFVSMVSHEFRTPLGVIMSAVELLQHYEDRLPAEQKAELLSDIRGATTAMAGLMEQVLLLGRVEAGKLGFRPVLVDLPVFAQKLAAETCAATRNRCPIVVECGPDLFGSQADETLLRHILSNLLSNAVKYSPPGSEILFRLERANDDALCLVKDHGIGIPEMDRPHLYEAFHRCENVGEIQGTGLGLVIVKRCVEMHSGHISFESETGQGTTFTVRLPLFAQAAAVSAA